MVSKQMIRDIVLLLLVSSMSHAQDLDIIQANDAYQVSINVNNSSYLQSPSEGLWSISTHWENDWARDWQHAQASSMEKHGAWTVLKGKLSLAEGDWHLQDAYRQENGRVKCIRRFEWKGQQTLDSVTLSLRWQVKAKQAQTFLPGIVFYGNPSGEKNGARKVPVYHGIPGEKAIFEEHRYPMPFASLEWKDDQGFKGAALHTIPSMIYGANHEDQWWSLGVEAYEKDAELVLLSGPISYNNRLSVAKALQQKEMPYKDAFIAVKPGTVIEKTFYLEAYDVTEKGSGFQRPIYTSIDIFKPYYTEDLPTYDEILEAKYRFTKSRYMETEDYAGFNMFPSNITPQIVLGWAGQSEAPIYALQVLQERFKDDAIWNMVQKSLDHIITSDFGDSGFNVNYNTQTKAWSSSDPVSQGQAMNSIALAIKTGRKHKKIQTANWEKFFRKACDFHAKRILDAD